MQIQVWNIHKEYDKLWSSFVNKMTTKKAATLLFWIGLFSVCHWNLQHYKLIWVKCVNGPLSQIFDYSVATEYKKVYSYVSKQKKKYAS